MIFSSSKVEIFQIPRYRLRSRVFTTRETLYIYILRRVTDEWNRANEFPADQDPIIFRLCASLSTFKFFSVCNKRRNRYRIDAITSISRVHAPLSLTILSFLPLFRKTTYPDAGSNNNVMNVTRGQFYLPMYTHNKLLRVLACTVDDFSRLLNNVCNSTF